MCVCVLPAHTCCTACNDSHTIGELCNVVNTRARARREWPNSTSAHICGRRSLHKSRSFADLESLVGPSCSDATAEAQKCVTALSDLTGDWSSLSALHAWTYDHTDTRASRQLGLRLAQTPQPAHGGWRAISAAAQCCNSWMRIYNKKKRNPYSSYTVRRSARGETRAKLH